MKCNHNAYDLEQSTLFPITDESGNGYFCNVCMYIFDVKLLKRGKIKEINNEQKN